MCERIQMHPNENELPLEIDVLEVQALRDDQQDFLWLDCREPREYATAHLPGTQLIPIREIPQQLAALQTQSERRVIVMCHHGNRSLMAARWLRENGIANAQSMSGGIDDWSQSVDPSVPRY